MDAVFTHTHKFTTTMTDFVKIFSQGTWVSPCYKTIGELVNAINTIQGAVIESITEGDKTEEDKLVDATVGCPIVFDKSYPNLTEEQNYNLFASGINASIEDCEMESPVFGFALFQTEPYLAIVVQVFDGEDEFNDDFQTYIDVAEMFFDDDDEETEEDDDGEPEPDNR